MRLGSNYLNHGADFIWNNARLYDPETMKMLDTDPNEVRDLLNSGISYGLGKVGKAVIAGDQGIKKIFNLNKSPLEYYGGFRDEICTTQNQKDFMDCFGTGIATGGILKGVGALGGYAVEGAYLIKNKISPYPFPKYAIVKQEIKLLEYLHEKPRIYNMGDVVEYRGNEWTFADRLKDKFLNDSRLGELSGKLSYQDILDLAHSPKAQYFMDYGKDFKQYTKNPSISVLQNVEGISEKKLLRITLMSDEHRIYSIGVEDVQRISNRIESGRYVRITTKYEK